MQDMSSDSTLTLSVWQATLVSIGDKSKHCIFISCILGDKAFHG